MTHPGVEVIRAFLGDSGVTTGTIGEQREAMADLARSSLPPDGVAIEPVMLGGCRGEWLTPASVAIDAVVLYLHGGGYCTGSLDSHRNLASRLAVAAGCPVVTLDYRLAPEHPFPAAVDDAAAAYGDLLALGIPPERMAIAGDSAGGGLTVASLLALRATGSPLPAAAVCLSPWVDLTQTSGAYQRLAAKDPMVTKAGLDLMAQAYLGATDPRAELASPLFAEDLSGLPPLFIEVGEHEVLIDDAIHLAERVAAAGGEATLTVWPEMVHVFQAFPGPLIPESEQSVAAIGSFLADHVGRSD